MRYVFEDYSFDTNRRELHRGAEAVTVAPQVFDLLDYLICNRERVVSKDDLINAVWDGRVVSDAALTTRLNVARGVIGDSGQEQRLIKTLPRKGFRFIGLVQELDGPESTIAPGVRAEPPQRRNQPEMGHRRGMKVMREAMEIGRDQADFVSHGPQLLLERR